jgi:ribosomal protein S18 acetylase RimI-like enzyme
MMNLRIRKLSHDEEVPLDLLLLADPSEKIIKSYFDRRRCYVAELDNEIVGIYVLLPTRPKTVEIVNVAVKEEKHGQGIGKLLVEHAVRIAKEAGNMTVEIGTGNSSIGQLALYQKCGFRITGIDQDFFTRHYEEVIVENGIQCRDMIRLALHLSQ